MTTERRQSILSKKSTSSKVADAHQKTTTKKKQTSTTGLKYAIAWIAYVLLGSWIFIVLERTTTETTIPHNKWTRFKELSSREDAIEELRDLEKDLKLLCPHVSDLGSDLDDNNSGSDKNDFLNGNVALRNYTDAWISEIESICWTSLHIVEVTVEHTRWSMVDAIYYTMTLVTTIGFGYIYPTTQIGRLFCIPYALVGVPLTCILMAKSSDMLSNRMLHFYETTKKRYGKHPKLLLGVVTWMFLIVGCIVFMFLPSVVFVILEDWTYANAIYFTFITLTTIGFGDLVAGYGDPQSYSDVYKIGIVVWIMISLGYWIFLLNFLQKAIKSNAKTLKKTFRSKNISKQAEFLKQLITKVKQQEAIEEDEDDYDKRLHMMALIVESLSGSTADIRGNASIASLHSNRTGLSRNSISKSVTSEVHSSHNMDEPITMDADDRKKTSHHINLEDLLRVNVSVKTEMVPGFQSLLEQSVSRENLFDSHEGSKEGSRASLKVIKEVTLPLKDVLSIVLFAASVEGHIQQKEDDTPSEISATSLGGPMIDPKESVPLLKSILVRDPLGKTPNGFNLHENKEHSQGAYFKSAMNSYVEDCEAQLPQGIQTLSDDEEERRNNNKLSLGV